MVAIDWRKSWSNLPSDGCGRLGFQDAQVGSMASHRRQPWQVYYRPQQPFIAAGAAAYLSAALSRREPAARAKVSSWESVALLASFAVRAATEAQLPPLACSMAAMWGKASA